MLHKINNQKHFIVNALILAGCYTLAFVLVLLPFVLFAMTQNPTVLDDAEEEVYLGRSATYQALDSVVPFVVFAILGALTEFVRSFISAALTHSFDQFKKRSIPGCVYTCALIIFHLAIILVLQHV